MLAPTLETIEYDVNDIRKIGKIERAIAVLDKIDFPGKDKEIAYLQEGRKFLLKNLKGQHLSLKSDMKVQAIRLLKPIK